MVIALLVLVGLLATVNLLFTYGVVRRLKEHEERFTTMGSSALEGTPGKPAVGSAIPEFHAVAVDGRQVNRDVLAEGEGYIGFFSTDCAPCKERMPQYAAFAGEWPYAPVVAVITGPEADALEWAEHFGTDALVVIQEELALAQTFEVDGFPTMLALRDGTVEVNAVTLESLRRFVQA